MKLHSCTHVSTVDVKWLRSLRRVLAINEFDVELRRHIVSVYTVPSHNRDAMTVC